MRTPRFFATLAAGLVCSVAAASPAFAQIPCTNDTDCPGATCGSPVCQWSVGGHSCVTAGTDPEGFDGWCTADSNCKCVGFGATCSSSSHCTFTLPQGDAAAVAASSSGSSTGSTSTAPGAAGCSMGRSAGCARYADGYAAALAGVAFAGLVVARRRHRRQQEVA
jgi:hypothetical protein